MPLVPASCYLTGRLYLPFGIVELPSEAF
jgi:hypothetical protein